MKALMAATVALTCIILPSPAYSGHGPAATPACDDSCSPTCCASCGQKTCRLVCDVKEVKKVVWVVECEEFCVPCPRCPKKGCCGKSSCASTDCGDSCDGSHAACCDPHRRCLVPPKCGKVRCRKKLIKKEITCKVPIYKCIVCGTCCGAHTGCSAETPAPAEQAPAQEKQALRPAPLPSRLPLPDMAY